MSAASDRSSRALQLEPLTRERADELAEALLAMTRDSDWDDWDRGNLLAERPDKWQLSILAVLEGSPVAWAIASRTSGSLHLHHIVVAPQHRGEGIGEVMVTKLLRRAAPDPMTLKVHPSNGAAARFYERLGFVEGDRTATGYRTYSLRPAADSPAAPSQTDPGRNS